MRKDKRRSLENSKYAKKVELLFKKAKKTGKSKLGKLESEGYSIIDKGAKKGIIHKNKANRLKRRISRIVKKA